MRWPLLALPAAAALLAGCSASRSDTAWEVIERQKAEQRLLAQHEAEQARQRVPPEPRLMQSMIRETLAQGRYFAALAYIDAYVQRHGSDPDIEALRARALRLTGQTEQSEQVYRSLLKAGRAAQAWHGLGLLAGARGDFVQAAQYLQRAAALSPTDADVLNDLGYARLRAGDVAGARIPLGQAAELAPANTRTLANMAVLLLVQGQAVQAQRLMEQAAFSSDVRSQVYRLAQDVQAGQRAAAPAAGGAAPAGQPGTPLAEHFNHSRMTQ
ncbi:tetratricopeptide repeat protein [Orrella sp. JC864]|uniref:tetratricopeptide repeat protein n=1 Tax=Orrella sp. JC864 TaxID=3120298 RepID=UPI0012BC52B6